MPDTDTAGGADAREDVLHLGDAAASGTLGLRRPPRETVGPRMLGALLVLALALLGGAAILALQVFLAPQDADTGSSPGGPVSQDVPKVRVDPVEYLAVTPESARAINAAKPFSTAPNPPAAPLILSLPADETARATDCLAAAAWYEAGDHAAGEQAVVQVIINRMRHPAFPKTVCGVVFQGSERSTGCQFTFTCDGALRRTPSAAAWRRAQGAAAAGLNGLVFAPVGWATHYHTDWVVPNWNSGVDKIASLGGHLFFRWPGAAGRPSAFRRPHQGVEPRVAALAALSPAHRGDADADAQGATVPTIESSVLTALPDETLAIAPVSAATLRGNTLQGSNAAANLHILAIKPGETGGTLALVALDLCREQGTRGCTVIGFVGSAGRVVANAGRLNWPDRAPDFYYFRDPTRGREQVLWNCRVLPRPNPAQCIPADFSPPS